MGMGYCGMILKRLPWLRKLKVIKIQNVLFAGPSIKCSRDINVANVEL